MPSDRANCEINSNTRSLVDRRSSRPDLRSATNRGSPIDFNPNEVGVMSSRAKIASTKGSTGSCLFPMDRTLIGFILSINRKVRIGYFLSCGIALLNDYA